MTVTERCMCASQNPPDKWPIEVLDPLPMHPEVSIFGHSHVAMGEDKSETLAEALVWTGLAESMGDAKRALKSGAVRVNRIKESNPNRVLTRLDALPNLDAIVLELGKYNYGIIELCKP